MLTSNLKNKISSIFPWTENEENNHQDSAISYFDFDYLEDIMEKNTHFNEQINRFDHLNDK